jgi:hypothetical protein
MVHTDSLLPFLDGIPHLFFDSVRVRGFTHVVATLPPGQGRAIKVVLKNSAQSQLPSTDEVWRTWPQLLIDSGFGCLVANRPDEAPLVPDQMTSADETAGGGS